jgi:hypothetical protein
MVVTGNKTVLVVDRSADDTSELSFNKYQPGPHPELPSAAHAAPAIVKQTPTNRPQMAFFKVIDPPHIYDAAQTLPSEFSGKAL